MVQWGIVLHTIGVPMRKRVPLNSIRAFEATARNSSVAKAADELCVTPTAVSHQIRLLEEFLQVQLFLRKSGRIELTQAARETLPRVTKALDLINDAILGLGEVERDERRRLSVAASTSVASLWLMPRIGEFVAKLPDTDLSIRTFVSPREAEEQHSDLRICNWQSALDCQIEPLLDEEITPVASPALIERFGGARAALAEAPLIHVDRPLDGPEGPYPVWPRFLSEFGVSRKDMAHGPRFNQASTAIEAATAGVGILLGRSLLLGQAMARDELARLTESYPIRSRYYLLSPWKSEGRASLLAFKDWLFDMVRKNHLIHAI